MLRSVQVLRGVAACSVVLIHAYYQSGHGTLKLGAVGAGVDLFFVISGFIMATIAKRPTFLFNRFWRIYPLWLVAVLPWLWVKRRWVDWPTLTDSLTLWPVYGKIASPVLLVGWTLSFEMLFYFAVALSLRTGAKIPLAMFALFVAGGILTDAPIFDFLGSPMIFEFLFGVIIAKLPKIKAWAVPIFLVALLLLALSPAEITGGGIATGADAAWGRVLSWGFPCALLFYSVLTFEQLFHGRVWNLPVLLGDASYSIYLFHLAVVRQLRAPWQVVLMAAIGAGVFIWWAVEQRILAMKPSLTRKRPTLDYAPSQSQAG